VLRLILCCPILCCLTLCCPISTARAEPRSVSGIYPHLATFNDDGECGTGAVVPWAGKLWIVSYAPHKPRGSTDKLYEITPDLKQIVRPESIGGTPANRMIHRESNQLFIGPYAIDDKGGVRVISYETMFGRPTGNARHLFDPAGKIYCASMEEALYEIDVKTLAVTELWTDEQKKEGRHANLPGYHGKGLYSGQGRIIYANNGEHGAEALKRPDVPSGCLVEWDGKADTWTLVRRSQFTEVTGPGGIYGNEHPATDPVWAVGWDHRSLILMALDAGKWHSYRLPKGSHSYDGAHGWNTEWPRIREIGDGDLLMTMHGTFWRFPRKFSAGNSAGIRPRSNYIKVIADFAKWNDRIVFGCDDSAKSEFLNKRKAKGGIEGPGRSQSNLWFVKEEQIDALGPVIGRGAVWLDEAVKANEESDAYLFSGYAIRGLHLLHDSAEVVTFSLEVDAQGNGQWKPLKQIEVPAKGYVFHAFSPQETGAWVRLKANRDCAKATAFFNYRNVDARTNQNDAMFAALAKPGDKAVTGGVMHARGKDFRTLRFIAANESGDLGVYDLDGRLKLEKTDDPKGHAYTSKGVAIPKQVLDSDAASVLYIDDAGKRWRFPRGQAGIDQTGPLGALRVCREVCTERDLFNVGGTFYELPAENAGGLSKIRPIATHNLLIKDYATYRGLLALSGLRADAEAGEHVVNSDDGKCALWLGAVDDLWKLGKPRGRGGPWKDTAVKAHVPSDPYLMTGYDKKRVRLSHTHAQGAKMRIEVDLTGTGVWAAYATLSVEPGKTTEHAFPDAFVAYWVRIVADQDTTATATLIYE
jgi:hypothetical protein